MVDDIARLLRNLRSPDMAVSSRSAGQAADLIERLVKDCQVIRDNADQITKSAVRLLSRDCPTHGSLHWEEFAAKGGKSCPICQKQEIDTLRTGLDGLTTTLEAIRTYVSKTATVVRR